MQGKLASIRLLFRMRFGVQEAAVLGWSLGLCHCTLSCFQQRQGRDLGQSCWTQLWLAPLGFTKSCHQLYDITAPQHSLTLQVKLQMNTEPAPLVFHLVEDAF